MCIRDSGWEVLTSLSFTSPVATATEGALVGNSAPNRTSLAASLPDVMLAPEEAVCIRWRDVNDDGNDHGLAIDDLVVTGTPAP